ncbi:hypothetical protein SAZ11_05960 [Streptomyces sp. FXJ1.4098]|nr:hypothetical protein [Streptomyces sp. FXJ1.4098]
MNGPERQHSTVEELFAAGGSLGSLMSGIDWRRPPWGVRTRGLPG